MIYNSFFGTKNNRGCHRCCFGGRDSPQVSLELIARALKCFLMTSHRGHGWMTQYPPQIFPGGDFVLTVCPSNWKIQRHIMYSPVSTEIFHHLAWSRDNSDWILKDRYYFEISIDLLSTIYEYPYGPECSKQFSFDIPLNYESWQVQCCSCLPTFNFEEHKKSAFMRSQENGNCLIKNSGAIMHSLS